MHGRAYVSEAWSTVQQNLKLTIQGKGGEKFVSCDCHMSESLCTDLDEHTKPLHGPVVVLQQR